MGGNFEATLEQEDSVVGGEETDFSELQIDAIDILGESMPEAMWTYSSIQQADARHADGDIGETLARIPGARVAHQGGILQRQEISFRGAGTQDIGVLYRGVAINALSDASADLSWFPVPLVSGARAYASGAGMYWGASAGLITLDGKRADTTPNANLSINSLLDESLFVDGNIQRRTWQIDGAAFGDWSRGAFDYIDEQGSRQRRVHNEASRIGAQMGMEFKNQRFQIDAFSLLSAIVREEPGVSEYPAKFKRARHEQWLSLTGFHLATLPVALDDHWLNFDARVSHRAMSRHYENPTSWIGNRPTWTDALENETLVSFGAQWDYKTLSQTRLDIQYRYQNLANDYTETGRRLFQDHSQHVVSLAVAESVQLWRDRIRISGAGRADAVVDGAWLPSGSAAFSIAPLDWLSFRISSGYSQRMPSFDERYYRTEYMRGDPDLKPQKSLVNEITVAVVPNDKIQIAITGFYNLHQDLIRFIPETPYLFLAKNIDDATARGVTLNAAAQLWMSLGVAMRYTWLQAKTEDGYPIPASPEHQTGASIFWHGSNLRAEISFSYQSSFARNFSNTAHAREKYRLDAEVSYAFNRHIIASIFGKNLTDDKRAQDFYLHPQPGIHFGLSLKLSGF